MSKRYIELLLRCHRELNRPVLFTRICPDGAPRVVLRLEWVLTSLGAPSRTGLVERHSPVIDGALSTGFLEDMLEEMLETAKRMPGTQFGMPR